MFSTRCNVRLTHIRDVKPTRSFTTSKLQMIAPTSLSTIHNQARQRTRIITNYVQRSHYNMSSNNKDLELGSVFDVKDKVALVTGGGSGIGLMITQTLAVNGAKVYIVGRTEEKLQKVAEVHGKDIAGKIIPVVGDVSTKEGVQYVE
jgi:FlaA1/EpsC-like NDP-sugar epimerase